MDWGDRQLTWGQLGGGGGGGGGGGQLKECQIQHCSYETPIHRRQLQKEQITVTLSVDSLSKSTVCLSRQFVSADSLSQPTVCLRRQFVSVRNLSLSSVCTTRLFVPVDSLSQSTDCMYQSTDCR